MKVYQCRFYLQAGQKRSPVEKYIDGVDEDAQLKFVYQRSLLEQLGPWLREPHAKNLGHGIYELRFSGRDSNFRVLYFFDEEKAILTNAFKKKTQKTPRNEIALAMRRRQLYLESKKES